MSSYETPPFYGPKYGFPIPYLFPMVSVGTLVMNWGTGLIIAAGELQIIKQETSLGGGTILHKSMSTNYYTS